MTSPMPQAWAEHGAPPDAIATWTEGACPVHRTPLDPGTMLVGPPPRRLIPAGWCDGCRAWWHRPYQPGMESGLGVSWTWGQDR